MRKLSPLLSVLLLTSGCGTPAARPAATARSSAAPDAPAPSPSRARGRPARRAADRLPPVTTPPAAYATPEATTMLWVDLAALRRTAVWTRLRPAFIDLLKRSESFRPLFASPAADPLDHARTLIDIGSPAGYVLTIQYPPGFDMGAVRSLATSSFIPLSGCDAATLTRGDDASVLAIDASSRVIAASPGMIRWSLRMGPRPLRPFWRQGDLFADWFGPSYMPPRPPGARWAVLRIAPSGAGAFVTDLALTFSSAAAVPGLHLDRPGVRDALARRNPIFAPLAHRLRASTEGATVHLRAAVQAGELETMVQRALEAEAPPASASGTPPASTPPSGP